MAGMLLADQIQPASDLHRGSHGLIVSGLIILVLIVLGIWWLKR